MCTSVSNANIKQFFASVHDAVILVPLGKKVPPPKPQRIDSIKEVPQAEGSSNADPSLSRQ